ncbi:hypothetical protein [Glacieibacterium frigidum]|uniref:Uncharacterized protein n=1 Tax=Glacieibacterium frigidum TaxID=2593303 RepID=A0A552UGN3_9SPHN|nr:hypothetical protein [Glacieibacterium frigidum]TRW17380.1 hypothetical protein FMM06_04185 [Glacieibacterium frigidum]
MTGFERIGGTPPITATTTAVGPRDAGNAARTAMATIGDRVLAWSAQSFKSDGAAGATWQGRTGLPSSFTPDRAELARGGDVYQLRALTGELAQGFGATPAQEGALGRAIEDFARGVALRFNALADAPTDTMLGGVLDALDQAVASGAGDGIGGVTARIESAATMVEKLNR